MEKLSKDKMIIIEIINGVEGSCLSINNYRFAGSKPWGGGTVIKQWTEKKEDFIKSLERIGFKIAKEEVSDGETL